MTRSAIGPMSAAPLCAIPVAKACAVKGARTLSNSDGRVSAMLDGMPCSACTNSALVDGWDDGAGGVPRSGAVVDTVGVAPRLVEEPLGTPAPDGGCS